MWGHSHLGHDRGADMTRGASVQLVAGAGARCESRARRSRIRRIRSRSNRSSLGTVDGRRRSEPLEPGAAGAGAARPRAARSRSRWRPERWSPSRWSPSRWSPSRWSPSRWSPTRSTRSRWSPSRSTRAADPEPLEPEPLEPEPPEPDPLDPEPPEPGAAGARPVEPDPLDPEPSDPDPLEPDPPESLPLDPVPPEPLPLESSSSRRGARADAARLVGDRRRDRRFAADGRRPSPVRSARPVRAARAPGATVRGRSSWCSTRTGVVAAVPATATTAATFDTVTRGRRFAAEPREPLAEPRRGERGRGRAQRAATAHDELAHRAVRQPERAGDLLLRAPLHGDAQDRLALPLGQRRDAGQRAPHRHAALDLVLGRDACGHRVGQLGVLAPPRSAQRVERDVVHDPVQPGAQLADVVAAPQRPTTPTGTPAAGRPRRRRRAAAAARGAAAAAGSARRSPRTPARRPRARAPRAGHPAGFAERRARYGARHGSYAAIRSQVRASSRVRSGVLRTWRTGCEPVADALDAARAPAVLWFRDDDAGWDDARLMALLDCFADAADAARPRGDPDRAARAAGRRRCASAPARGCGCISTASRTWTTSARGASGSSGPRGRARRSGATSRPGASCSRSCSATRSTRSSRRRGTAAPRETGRCLVELGLPRAVARGARRAAGHPAAARAPGARRLGAARVRPRRQSGSPP